MRPLAYCGSLSGPVKASPLLPLFRRDSRIHLEPLIGLRIEGTGGGAPGRQYGVHLLKIQIQILVGGPGVILVQRQDKLGADSFQLPGIFLRRIRADTVAQQQVGVL